MLVVTKTREANKIFVKAISEETKKKGKQFVILFQEYFIWNMKRKLDIFSVDGKSRQKFFTLFHFLLHNLFLFSIHIFFLSHA